MDPHCNSTSQIYFSLYYRHPLGVTPGPQVCQLRGKEQINGFDTRGSIARLLHLWLIRSKHAGQKDSQGIGKRSDSSGGSQRSPAVKMGCASAWRAQSCKAHRTFTKGASQAAFKSRCFLPRPSIKKNYKTENKSCRMTESQVLLNVFSWAGRLVVNKFCGDLALSEVHQRLWRI